MASRPRSAGSIAIVCLLAVATAGCSSNGSQPGAASFYAAHGRQAARVGPSVRAVEAEVDALANPPAAGALTRIATSAQQANERLDEVRSGWQVTEKGEEEELSTIETQLSEGSAELKNAMAALVTYAGNPSQAALVPYTTHLRSGREKWNEGVVQLWHLTSRSNPPTV
jgi:hypothetical protein